MTATSPSAPSPGAGGVDPRPLLGEPLPLDLLNTHWIEGDELQDLLDTLAGTRIWVGSVPIGSECRPKVVDEQLRAALREARDIVQAVAERPRDRKARETFNAVLARGYRSIHLDSGGPGETLVIDDPKWTIPWLAAEGYLKLLADAPDRIRQCRHPQCVLWFFDTSRAGQRRWCSMSICGNRAKASRYSRRMTLS